MTKPRFLTKSLFNLAIECPAKLYYTGKSQDYPNKSLDDSFLAALAEGGYQVGELAKLYYPGGVHVETLDNEEALDRTNALLSEDNAVIYEAAIRHKNLFIRADILIKKGRHLELVEVKAKSFDPSAASPFLTKKPRTLASAWKSYLYDVAFQKFVIQSSFPDFTVSANLMLADKTAACPVDRVNQKFRVITNAEGARRVIVSPDLDVTGLSERILTTVNVDKVCDLIYEGRDAKDQPAISFVARVNTYSDYFVRDEKLLPERRISAVCGRCEFRASRDEEVQGKKSGFKECWSQALGWKEKDFDEPTVLDLWNFRRKDELLDRGTVKLCSVSERDIDPKPSMKPGLSVSQRQWLQVKKAADGDPSVWIDEDGLRSEMNLWVFPLHFVDFETTMVALPFNKGRRPYEAIAFQFSHHVVHRDGRVEHRGEYLNTEKGAFPNYEFVRALKSQLESDDGTVFRYSNHENTFLNHIHLQLLNEDAEMRDRDELLAFIESITHATKGKPGKWVGDRDMVDLWDLVKRYYYDPSTNGSNSIKHVLPAILNSSAYLQRKYSNAIYGASGEIKSLNFKDWTWIKFNGDSIIDPYKLLPNMFEDVSKHDFEHLSQEDDIREGGAAMTAYARLQFEDLSDTESEGIRSALLRYCELDTLAMAMIYEGWREMLT